MQTPFSASAKLKQSVFVLTAAFGLAACGGGGGGESHQPQTQATPTPPVVNKQDAAKPSAPQNSDAAKPSAPAAPNQPEVAKPSVPAPSQPEVAKPSAPAAPNQPEVAKPSVPAAPSQPEVAKPVVPSDQEVFSRLNLYGVNQGITGGDVLKLTLKDGKNISLDLLQGKDSFNGEPFVRTFRDADGRLLGYLAHANVNHIFIDRYGEEANDIQSYYLQHIDDSSLKRPAVANDVRYSGKMYFHYPKSAPLQTQTASVQAMYHGSDKTLSMELISDKHGANRWYLFDQREARNPNTGVPRSERVKVDDDGRVTGHLLFDENGTREKLRPNGYFIGGFYGKNGSVLSGKAVNEYGEKWEGVLGATVSEPK